MWALIAEFLSLIFQDVIVSFFLSLFGGGV